MKQALVLLTLLGGIAFSAQAHEVWLERSSDGSVKVQFGEPGSEYATAEELASLKHAMARVTSASMPIPRGNPGKPRQDYKPQYSMPARDKNTPKRCKILNLRQ